MNTNKINELYRQINELKQQDQEEIYNNFKTKLGSYFFQVRYYYDENSYEIDVYIPEYKDLCFSFNKGNRTINYPNRFVNIEKNTFGNSISYEIIQFANDVMVRLGWYDDRKQN